VYSVDEKVGVTPRLRSPYLLVAAAGAAAALVTAVGGGVLERRRFGADDREAVARIERELVQQFNRSGAALAAVASDLADERDLIRGAAADEAAARALFEALERAPAGTSATGITVYNAAGEPLAWRGRVSDLPAERTQGPAALFVAPDALGLRLVRVQPVADGSRSSMTTRLGSIVVEQLLGADRVTPGAADTFMMRSSIAPVSVRAAIGGAQRRSDYAFVIPASDGQVLVEAEIAPAGVADARSRWRSQTVGWMLAVLALTMLVCTGPLLDARRRARAPAPLLAATAGLVGVLLTARYLLHLATVRLVEGDAQGPIDLLLWALLLVALVWLALDLIERRRVASPRPRLQRATVVQLMLAYAAAGAFAASLVWAYDRFLQNIVSRTTLDLLHFSLHPLSASRVAIGFGLILLHAGVFWSAALGPRIIAVAWRQRRSAARRAGLTGAWIAGALAAAGAATRIAAPVPMIPLFLALAAIGACALALGWPRGRMRRASQTATIVGIFAALVVPSLAMYPSLHAFTTEAKDRLVADQYGPAALRLRDDLQTSLNRAGEEIDALPSLSEFLIEPADETESTDSAYQLWSKTDLAAARVTSAVELYRADGRLVSRFFLNLPEYAITNFRAASCRWDVIDESSPIGSSERHVLRASRGICQNGRQLGTVAVRVMLDYRVLPFISGRTPYLESFRIPIEGTAEGAAGRDLEFVWYGWSRAPLYVSGTGAWPLPDRVFDRATQSRERFWDVVAHDDRQFRVHYLNDRSGIYALGYPLLTPFDHVVNLAELVTLGFVLYLLLLLGATLFNALTSRTPAGGRALLREVRSSFYRKLFLAFVLVAVLPVVILAFATRTYFANQFTAAVEEGAVRTATVAQRLVEDYATLQQRQTGALRQLDDSVMVIVGRAIDQAVNLFDDAELQATSERDLYASRLLPTRTPAGVYRAIVLDRMPTYVGTAEVGGSSYLVAAAPVRAGGREGIVTVPQTQQRQESERQTDELDRRVLTVAVLFVLLGAGSGYWMAERIADPVNRLTRATRRIARGDLDARIAATSSDELRRLVEDFNRMAADLKQQRAELERTQRLEAWADMARQVAHDIKNPLTPIQLSAEHARRVNLDRGRPLSPVLDDCVNAILTQVKLLRQISAEFSSFASSPTPRPEPTDVAALIEEVVESYRTALTGRIAVDVQNDCALPQVALDRTLFSRALTNIIENAIHAMPGGGRLTIASRREPADGGEAIVVSVADTGVGMGPDDVARIFEPYFSTKATGTGLGLTIAKRNIELNGGTIDVKSERGGGTTVVVRLAL
jgi:nitrogen fixation/metabolism regulation signal transduction histidine kinase